MGEVKGKGPEETFRGDGLDPRLDHSDGFMGIYIHQNLSKCTFETHAFIVCQLPSSKAV